MKPATTYVIEKIWEANRALEVDFSFSKVAYVNVRPCEVPYKTYRNFQLGKKTRIHVIEHGPSVAWWNAFEKPQMAFEKFMVDLEVNKQVTPMFENWILDANHTSYYAKTVDLKTGEVLYDGTAKLLSELRSKNLI